MRLEDIRAEIRPRRNWEAVDLGCALARRHFWGIFRGWLATVAVLWAIVIALLHAHPIWAIVTIWFLKPLYERVPLFYLSRALFGVKPKIRDLLKEWPKMLVRRPLHGLLLGRFSAWRSLVLPVAELEGLKGNQFYRRATVISGRAGTSAMWMQVASLMILHAVWIGLALLALILVPEKYSPDLRILFDDLINGRLNLLAAPVLWTWLGLYLTALTFVEPFYVGSGFGLYLNARTRIEGWDIELTFRRLAARLSENVPKAAAVMTLSAVFLTTPALKAQETQGPPPPPGEAIEEVLSHPDFEIETVKRYKIENEEDDEETEKEKNRRDGLSPLASVGQTVTSGIFWVILVLILGLIVAVVVRNLHIFSGEGRRGGGQAEKPRVTSVAGLNVEAESLPPDIIAQARKLWDDGQFQAAIGLLYRAALNWMIEQKNLPILECDTEIDCLRHAEEHPEQTHCGYFEQLTRIWIRTAYGHAPPANEELNRLCDQWPYHPARTK